jgi:hypothetical protein
MVGKERNSDLFLNISLLFFVKLLLEHKANVHARNNEALEKSIFLGHKDVVTLLLENKADIHDNMMLLCGGSQLPQTPFFYHTLYSIPKLKPNTQNKS